MINFIFEHKDEILNYSRIFVEVFILIIIFKYRYRTRSSDLFLDYNTQEKLILDFEPEDLVSEYIVEGQPTTKPFFDADKDDRNDGYMRISDEVENIDIDSYFFELADYDVFDYKFSNKTEIEKTIREYGIGTCGPPGFYGTLDIHLELEKKIADMLGTEAAILYSNSFTCVNSVITCFCKQNDIVFYHGNSNEAIVRALKITKGTSIKFYSTEELEDKIKTFSDKKRRNFIVTEALFKNTGEIVDLPKILDIKKKYKLRLILDESLSIPLLGKKGISEYYNTDINDIDMLIGSLAHVYCGNGGFSAGNIHTVDYQRLSAQSYCFSASMPGYLAKNAICNIEKSINLTKIRKNVQYFICNFKAKKYQITSHIDSPLIILNKIDAKVEKEKQLEHMMNIKQKLEKQKIRVGVSINPKPAIRVIIKENMDIRMLKTVLKKINTILH